MGHFRAIGDIFPGIIARAEAMSGFQSMINDLPTPERRKAMIMQARMGGLITDEETTLLVQVYQLETA